MEKMIITGVKTAVKQPYIPYDEYLSLAGEARITEWVDGEVINYMPPFYKHQDIIAFLATIIREFTALLHLGEIIIAPFEVKLWPDGEYSKKSWG